MYLFLCCLNAPYFSMCWGTFEIFDQSCFLHTVKITEAGSSFFLYLHLNMRLISLMKSHSHDRLALLLSSNRSHLWFKSRFQCILCPTSEAVLHFQFSNVPNVCVLIWQHVLCQGLIYFHVNPSINTSLPEQCLVLT